MYKRQILYRENDLSLCGEIYGNEIMGDGLCLMEIKTSGGMPLWLSHLLTEQSLFKTSFSKYGTAYRDMMRRHGSYKWSDYKERKICYVG